MSDGNKSDGPFILMRGGRKGGAWEWINGPVDCEDIRHTEILGEVVILLNRAYAEGRKSMEKDFQEALGWADSICLDWNYSKDYKKWKQARGIE